MVPPAKNACWLRQPTSLVARSSSVQEIQPGNNPVDDAPDRLLSGPTGVQGTPASEYTVRSPELHKTAHRWHPFTAAPLPFGGVALHPGSPSGSESGGSEVRSAFERASRAPR